MKHLIDKTCSCKYCQMIDVMFGDPLLNKWERDFVESVASFGWHKDYTPKQKAVIERLFKQQYKKYVYRHKELASGGESREDGLIVQD